MLPGWLIFGSALSYMLLLFVIAAYGDRAGTRRLRQSVGRPIIYSLSLAIYCTSWTYYGGVGLAASQGWEFIGIYIGPVLMFTLGMPLITTIHHPITFDRRLDLAAHDLERDLAVDDDVVRPVDRPEAAAAQVRLHPILPLEHLAGLKVGA